MLRIMGCQGKGQEHDQVLQGMGYGVSGKRSGSSPGATGYGVSGEG